MSTSDTDPGGVLSLLVGAAFPALTTNRYGPQGAKASGRTKWNCLPEMFWTRPPVPASISVTEPPARPVALATKRSGPIVANADGVSKSTGARR